MTRITDIRIQENIDPTILRIPYMFLQDQFGYSVESILRPMDTMTSVYMGSHPTIFPNTVSKYFWIQEGIVGVIPWIGIGVLENGLYFYYSAICNNTPNLFLDPNSHMNLWVSIRFSDIIQYVMDSVTYMKYIEETSKE